MFSRKWIVGMMAASLVACSSSSETTTEQTVASLMAAPPSTGTAVDLDVVVVVSQRNGQKWRAYVQDPGVANGLGLFCDANDTAAPCTVDLVARGHAATLTGKWDPKVASSVTPAGFAAGAPAAVTYADASTADVVAKKMASGTPVHLTGGPWVISDIPDAMKNPSFVAGDCNSGPEHFGAELTDESDGSKVNLDVKWFDQVSFTMSEPACAPNKTRLEKGMRFTKLGGLVEVGGGTSAFVLEPFSDADWAFGAKEGT